MVFFEEETVALLAGILGDTERISRPGSVWLPRENLTCHIRGTK
jgi:hypothetical protein